MIEKTFFYPRNNFTDLCRFRMQLWEDVWSIEFKANDLVHILPDELENAIRRVADNDSMISVKQINEIISDSTIPEVIDFYNWFNFELMPNIIRGINQFNMPVEVVIKDDE